VENLTGEEWEGERSIEKTNHVVKTINTEEVGAMVDEDTAHARVVCEKNFPGHPKNQGDWEKCAA